jgi:hypothetical protein
MNRDNSSLTRSRSILTDVEAVPVLNVRVGDRLEVYGRAWTIEHVQAQPDGLLLFTLRDPEREQVIQIEHAPSEHILRKKGNAKD